MLRLARFTPRTIIRRSVIPQGAHVYSPARRSFTFQSSEATASTAAPTSRAVKAWLIGNAGLVFGMVVVGGVTRLTKSGLSITDWRPITGAIPPLTEEDWQREFEKYKQFPEYQKVNYEMTVNEFKPIFFMEWAHRFLGRTIGFTFALPLLYFFARGHIKLGDPIVKALGGLFALGGAQGALGWYMVKSGLHESTYLSGSNNERPRVSQYRLAAHLGTAFVIYSGLVVLSLRAIFPKAHSFANELLPYVKKLRGASFGTAGLTFFTAMSGAFVAGLEAGLIYNEFPLMGGRLVPAEAFALKPTWKNFFENDAMVQFTHRALATTTLLHIVSLYYRTRRRPEFKLLPRRVRLAFHTLVTVVGIQVSLGITTLLTFVPVPLAAMHQAGSLTLLSSALWVLHELRIPRL